MDLNLNIFTQIDVLLNHYAARRGSKTISMYDLRELYAQDIIPKTDPHFIYHFSTFAHHAMNNDIVCGRKVHDYAIGMYNDFSQDVYVMEPGSVPDSLLRAQDKANGLQRPPNDPQSTSFHPTMTLKHGLQYRVGLSCEICGRDFENQTSLVTHRKAAHEIANSFECEICDKEFKAFYQARVHSCKNHYQPEEGFNLFSCPLCAKSFQGKKQLSVHQRGTHPGALNDTDQPITGFNTFECQTTSCPRRFPTERAMSQHMKNNCTFNH